MSAPATEIPTTVDAAPSGGTASGGQSAAAEPTAAAEPAVAPVSAPAPAPAATRSSHEEYDWEAWDGTSDGLPEDVRGWYSKFDERYKSEAEKAAMAHTEALSTIQQESEQYKRMYAAAFNNEEDPRVAELTTAQTTMQQQYEADRAAWEANEAGYKQIVTEDSDRYLGLVQTLYKEQLASITPEQMDAIVDALDDFDLHVALEITALGDGALEEATKLVAAGASQELVMRVLKSEMRPKPATTSAVDAEAAKEARRPKNHPSKVVAGAQPQQRASDVPAPAIKNMPIRDQRALAARRAIKAEGSRRG